jgi:arylsulfatase A-like enzyme
VFLLADDLGWADLGVYGADLHQTPNLDRFAASGVRFTNAYTASPVCSPTRASILTGKHPARLHMTIWREAAHHPPLDRKLLTPRTMDHLPHAEVTLGEVFKQAGYVTAHIGKWHLGTAEHYPQTQGYDYNIGGTLWGAPQTFFYPYSGDRYFREPRYVPHLEDGRPGEYLTDRLTSEAIEILERHQDQPFFLQLWYHSVHTPIEGKPDVAARYAKKIQAGMNHRNAHYAAMVESLDENVGRVLRKLDELGLAQNTVVVFTSDNGGFINNWEGEPVTSNAPLRSGKGSLYEGGVRVPAIVRWPGVTPAGGVSHTPVSSVDFFPTLLSIAGLSSTVRGDGTNLTPLLRNPSAKLNREALYFHYPHYYATTTPVSSIRVGDWKLLEYYEDGKLELYNLAQDPGEANDLAAANRESALNLRKRLHVWLDEVGAQLPTPNP